MIEPTLLFWLGALGMAVGTVAFVLGGISTESVYRRYYAILASISLIAAVAYAMMALEIGWVTVGDNVVFTPRYVDWILTTPLLLLFLGLLAGSDSRELGVVIAVNTAVMVLGFAAALVPGGLGYGLFVVAGIVYLGLLYLLLGPMSDRAAEQGAAVTSLFTSLRNLTVILWSVYPVIWLLGPPGLGMITPTVDIMLISYLDVLTKVGFGLIALNTGTILETERGQSIAEATADGPVGAD
ncbi:bacteriorhodopsin [Natrarchaeobaculum sulfurireducens]|uniref:Bacteriorhodopsin n=1 Tax=Natrarchaeobaculum sulfurireducens TaxID=2044521 RepID=A0A346PLU9_9EURY|nr:bacteriorhodopsin [Natrarchaeobaculum sulfurireducens]AXR76825.1 Bacteriorhodopsin [Natrarchaeobaculum sulfurireducens]AXR80494.1 Bacteriorhodopsin [Natrarchaeobaculum sulfurireducens]